MKRLLITGVGGNVGRSLALFFQDKYEVIGVFRNTKPTNLNCELIRADLSAQISEIRNVDIIIHAAARIKGSAEEMVKDNVIATNNLIRFAEEQKVYTFIYLSTVSVYGQVKKELCIDDDIINPGVYGSSKYIAEEMVKESAIPNRFILGLPRMLGPFVDWNNTEGSGFLTMAKRILIDESVTCYIPNVKYNNYLHVNDLAVFIDSVLSAEKNSSKFEKYLIGVSEKKTMLEIIETMKNSINSRSEIVSDDRKTIPLCSLISIDRAIKAGFFPMSAEETINRFMKESKNLWK